jgi:4-amino-4-deoxy-L-arabinose transferase-like glycosyltransferase
MQSYVAPPVESIVQKTVKQVSASGLKGRQLFWIVVVAVVLRMAMILIFQDYRYDPSYTPSWYGAEAGGIARSLAEGHGFASPFGGDTGPTAWLSPVYPAICAAVFKFFGIFSRSSLGVILGLNSLAAGLTVIPLYRFAVRIFSPMVALVTVLLWAVVPYFMRWPTTMVWESSFTALLVAWTLAAALWLADSGSLERWVAYGALASLSALTNPAILSVSVLAAIWAAARLHRQKVPILRSAAVSVLVLLIMVSPWLVRNRAVFGQGVFLRDNFGFEFHLGNYHFSNGMGWRGRHPIENKSEYRLYQQLGEVAYVAHHQAEAMQFVREYPCEFAGLTWMRFCSFWNGSFLPYLPNEPWKPWMYWSLALAAAGGLALALATRIVTARLLLAVLLLYPLPYYLTYPKHRYRHAIEPELLLLAVYLVLKLAESWLARRREFNLNSGERTGAELTKMVRAKLYNS